MSCVERPITPGETSCRSSSRRAGALRSATWMVPVPDGQPFVTGGGVGVAAATTALGTDVACAEPSLFFAVTRTRSVLSWSTCFSAYVFSVAPLMFEQLPPSLSQRRHWYVNVIGVDPFHFPGSAVNVSLTFGVPEIVGGVEFVGATVEAAPPSCVALNTAPIAVAARARSTAPSARLRRNVMFEKPPLVSLQRNPVDPVVQRGSYPLRSGVAVRTL